MADADLSFLVLCVFLLPLFLLIFLKLIVRPRLVKIPIKSRHVFITGGSSGIGLAVARQAAAEGARVTILARNLDKLEEAKTFIRLSTGIDVAIVSADVCDFEAVKESLETAGPIDVLICNQGVFAACELENQDIKEIKGMIDVNLIGTFNLVKAALPGMKNRSDRKPVSIAFMSSQSGQLGIYGYAAYSASKFGLRGLAEALQQEVIADDIHISLIFPSDTDTPGLAEEKKRRPPLTSIIAASSGAMQAGDEVAKISLNGIKSGSFFVPCNFMGFLLSIGTAGMSPQRSYLMAFVEVIAVGVLRIVGLCFQWKWYGSIEKWRAQEKQCISTQQLAEPADLGEVQQPAVDRLMLMIGGLLLAIIGIMPKVKTNRVKYPEGWELVEPTLTELQAKMREAENDPHDGKRKCEALWPIFKIAHQKSRYIFDLYHRRKEISAELYEFCLDQGYADRNIIAKWKKPGYERLCCLRCIQPRDHNFNTTCVCRVPKHLREEKVIECVHCGCKGCASGD
ncbi:hypothetical protein L1987_86824 [Smallanthus sonchifolius]|uniref:Uncharacterized protein n=1 Tax=Smallanthus sonchifolius TaxID=185202 RepID=A0ACB8Y0F5_9ASTR|nr:hypothetical protein L1987_86824 [Smallanthus sonchifolius]